MIVVVAGPGQQLVQKQVQVKLIFLHWNLLVLCQDFDKLYFSILSSEVDGPLLLLEVADVRTAEELAT